ncbi:hypothetical protein ACJ8BA_28270, partial [Klebsiella pneumoniae]
FFAVRSPLTPAEIGTGCANVFTFTRYVFPFRIWSVFAVTPRISAYVLNVVSSSLPLPRPLAH